MRGILYILASSLPTLQCLMYANKLRVQVLQKLYCYELFSYEASKLLMKLSCLVSSMVNPSFSEQVDNICGNYFILLSKTAVDTSNKTLAIFWHTSIGRLCFW